MLAVPVALHALNRASVDFQVCWGLARLYHLPIGATIQHKVFSAFLVFRGKGQERR